ncbi:unnamed protein product [Larinioides sclopetarius]|uniref:Uncharacterized protein n=1 Tax=Larinioides sclopetarius TaxID=280406 RepID=A0AAV2A474_9ARAC
MNLIFGRIPATYLQGNLQILINKFKSYFSLLEQWFFSP